MSNILKVTTPVVGYDNTINKQNVSQAENLAIKNPVDPSKIVRADGKSEANGEQGVNQNIKYDSNFGNFVQTLKDIPVLREIMTKMVFGGMANLVESGIGKGTAQDINDLFEMLKMSPDELKNFLQHQMAGANKLQGPLFDLMRQVMGEATTVELKGSILNFLKKYNDMSSGEHIYNNMKGLLDEIGKYMFRNDREALKTLTAGLLPYSLKTTEDNARIMKQEIIPFLAKYVADTRDMGRIRDVINLLTFNLSRFENGSIDGVTQAFQKLMSFPAFERRMEGMSADDFQRMLMNVDYDKAAGKTEWSDKLLNIIQAGVKGEAGIENREQFVDIMRSMLINESVYMPVMHVMIPVILDGVPMFSEIWVDPDEESGNEGSTERGVKLLLKFDMKDVGFFDIIMYYENGKLDMLMRYPESLAEHDKDIKTSLEKIIRRNNMEVEYLGVEVGKESIPVSSVFPKIFERRNAVNVTI